MAGEIELLPERNLTHVVGHDTSGLVGRQASGFRVLGQSSVAVSCTASTSEEVLASVVVPAGAMGPNGRLFISTLWTVTSSANNKNLRTRFGGISGTIYGSVTATTVACAIDQRIIANRNSESSQVGSPNGTVGGLGATPTAVSTSTVDTSLATTVDITGQKASAGETLTLESYCVEVFYAA